MASSRRTGTNENVSTFGDVGHGRDYTDLGTWEADTDYNLVSATTSEVLEGYADAASYNDRMSIAGATTSSSYFRIFRPASGEFHDGTPTTGFKLAYVGGSCLSIAEDYTQAQDIIGTSTDNSSTDRSTFYISNTDHNAYVGCMAVDSANSGSGKMYGFYTNWSNNTYRYFVNCLAHNIDEYGFYWVNALAYGYAYAYNCTATDCQYGFLATVSHDVRAKNCCSSDNSIQDWSGSFISVTCTAEGANPTYLDSASDDFRLDPSDTVCIGNGTDLSADGIYAFDDDIELESRPNGSDWDIGFDECYIPGEITPNEMIIELISDNGGIVGNIQPNESVIELISDAANIYGYISVNDSVIQLVCDSPSTGNLIIDWSIASTVIKELTTSYTYFIGFQGAYDKQICTLILVQDSTGNRSVSLPSNVRDNDDVSLPLSLSTTANLADYLTMIYRADIDKYDILSFVKGYG